MISEVRPLASFHIIMVSSSLVCDCFSSREIIQTFSSNTQIDRRLSHLKGWVHVTNLNKKCTPNWAGIHSVPDKTEKEVHDFSALFGKQTLADWQCILLSTAICSFRQHSENIHTCGQAEQRSELPSSTIMKCRSARNQSYFRTKTRVSAHSWRFCTAQYYARFYHRSMRSVYSRLQSWETFVTDRFVTVNGK